jgi:hypothetical protein
MELSSFQEKTEIAIDECKGSVKFCSKNALVHLRKAYKLIEFDAEMAVFRAITAEEEAASSIFHMLKNQQYQHANKLNFKEHKYKQGLFPFVQSVILHMSEFNEWNNSPVSSVHLEHCTHNGRKAIQLHLELQELGLCASPTPPLHFSFTDKESGQPITFNETFKKTFQGNEFDSAVKYLKKLAVRRNEILYASSSGLPKVSGNVKEFVDSQKNNVFKLLNLLLLCDPWINEGRSAFVQQALDAFLVLMDKISASDMVQSPSGAANS